MSLTTIVNCYFGKNTQKLKNKSYRKMLTKFCHMKRDVAAKADDDIGPQMNPLTRTAHHGSSIESSLVPYSPIFPHSNHMRLLFYIYVYLIFVHIEIKLLDCRQLLYFLFTSLQLHYAHRSSTDSPWSSKRCCSFLCFLLPDLPPEPPAALPRLRLSTPSVSSIMRNIVVWKTNRKIYKMTEWLNYHFKAKVLRDRLLKFSQYT